MTTSIDVLSAADLLKFRASEVAHHNQILAWIDSLLKVLGAEQPELPFYYPDDESDTYFVDDSEF